MDPAKPDVSIREEDIEVRSIQRRTFLGRFGIAAGVVGLVGWTAGCGGGESSGTSDPADSDSGDPVLSDSDPSDPVHPDEDSDTGDPADSD